MTVRQESLRPGHHLGEVPRPADRGDDDVAIAKVCCPIDDARAALYERLGLGAGSVVDRQVAAVLQQARGEHRSHPARADPAECHALSLHSVPNAAAIGARASMPAATAVEPRTINSGLKIPRRWLGSPVSICSSNSRAAAAPKSWMGTWTVVSAGTIRLASGMSLYPAIATPAGLRRPIRRAARKAPTAVMSVTAKIAVGESSSDSSRSAAPAPPSSV